MECRYKNGADENCISRLAVLFENMEDHVYVQVLFGSYVQFAFNPYISHERFMNMNNFFARATCWKEVLSWHPRVTYTVRNRTLGKILFEDIDNGKSSEMYRDVEENRFVGKASETIFHIIRKKRIIHTSDKLVTSDYEDVQVEKTKTYLYETSNSSWLFRLSIVWMGKTVEDAKNTERFYQFSIESSKTSIAMKDPKYSAASLCEKILDACGRDSDKNEIKIRM